MVEAATIEKRGTVEKRGPQPEDYTWYPDLRGKTCVIVASGPSATDDDLNILKDRDDVYIIAINESFKLVPFGHMLYGCDHQWWYKRKRDWQRVWRGLKVTQDRLVAEVLIGEDIKRVVAIRGRENCALDQPGYIGWGGNSGFQALNLALHFKPAKIILVGYDMTLKNGAHWHGQHGNGLHNPKDHHVVRWRGCVDRAYATLQREKVAGFNASMRSALNSWPKLSLPEALEA